MRLTAPINPAQLGAVPLPSGSGTVNLEPAMAALAKSSQPPRLNLADVKISQYSRSFATTLGYAGLFTTSTNVKSSLYLVEFLATTPEIQVPGQDNVAMTMGVGVRVALATNQIEGKGVGNLAGIAAMAELDSAQQMYTLNLIGLPGPVATAFNDAFPPLRAKFDLQVMMIFGTAISRLAASMIQVAKDDPTQLAPQPIKIVESVPEPYSVFGIAASNGYALHRITQSDTFDEALERLGNRIAARNRSYPYDRVDPTAVEIIYNRLIGESGDKPTSDERNLADRIQRLGR